MYEQKLVKVDDFSEIEEKPVKEKIEKRKRWEVAENNKLFLKKKKNKRKIRKKKKLCGND